MFSTIPKYIKFHILTGLTWQDLKNCALLSHAWHDLLIGDEFWNCKLRHDYGFVDNPNKISWRTWYYRVANSSILYRCPSPWSGITVTSFENIYKMWTCLGGNYYLNISGHLYFMGAFLPGGDQKWFGSSRVHKRRPLFLKGRTKSAFGLNLILVEVKHMIPTHYGDFVLTSSSELSVYTDTGNDFLVKSVKMIYGNNQHIVYQTHALDLYYLEFTGKSHTKLQSKFIASNVSFVGHVCDYPDVLECDIFTKSWYVFKSSTQDHRTISRPKIYHINKNHHLIDCRTHKIIDSNVKTIISPNDSFYIKYRPKLQL